MTSASHPTRPPAATAGDTRLARGPINVAALIGRLTRPALGQRGLAGADILTHWPTIVGADLAALAAPMTLKSERGRPGGTLTLRVAAGGAATLVQMKGPQIIARINGYFGYAAVTRLQVARGSMPVLRRAQITEDRIRREKQLPAETTAAIERSVAAVASESLRGALARLGVAVCRRALPAEEYPSDDNEVNA